MSHQPLSQRPLRALVVDDDLDSVILLTTLLEMYEIEVTAAQSASQAMQELRSHPDILISDLAMPLTDGYGLIQQIRALPIEQGGEIPAIAVSAWMGDEVHDRALQSGFQAFLSKPYQPTEIIELVSELTSWQVSAEVAA